MHAATFAHRWHWFDGTAGRSVEILPDGGYLVAGETRIDSIRDGVVVFSVDSLGDTVRVRHFPDYEPGSGLLSPVADGGHVVVGLRDSRHISVTHYTATDDSTWAWRSAFTGSVSAVIPTFDGGCLIAGRLPDTSASFGMVKLTADGRESWVRSYRDPRVHGSFARGVTQTRDSGFILCGDCYDYQGPYLRLVRTNSNGDTLWTRIHTRLSGPYVPAVCEASDSGFLLAGSELDTVAGTNALCILRTNSVGDIVWSRRIAPPGTQTGAAALAETGDGGYVIGAQIDWFDTARVWLVRLNPAGDTQWTSILSGVLRENVAAIRPTADLGYVIAGTSEAAGGSLLLYKTDSLGKILSSITEEHATPPSPRAAVELTVCPNPMSGKARVSCLLAAPADIELGLYQLSGRRLRTLYAGRAQAGVSGFDLRISDLPSGVYFLKLIAGPCRATRAFILN